MATFSFQQARRCVVEQLLSLRHEPAVDVVPLLESAGRVLAVDVSADRDYPTLSRSVRDGFAVRAEDFPGKVKVTGEVRAGDRYEGRVAAGQAVEIMTGAPIPEGANAIIMVEHVTHDGEWITTERPVTLGEFINVQGCEAKAGVVVLTKGKRIDYADVALLATVGCTSVHVYRRPSVAILATGDEVVDLSQNPLPHQIRNSNSYSLAVQVKDAGGMPCILPVARDSFESTRALVKEALQHDLVLLSGGVSAGKYDIVEKVLAEFGAEFHFDRVKIQPGQPLVFGRASDKFFFGLPGNPASTMVTFALFAKAAVQLLAGEKEASLFFTETRLSRDFRHKTGLTRFLPASLSADGSVLTPIGWSGSGDVPAVSRANAFLVTDPDRESWAEGDRIQVLMK